MCRFPERRRGRSRRCSRTSKSPLPQASRPKAPAAMRPPTETASSFLPHARRLKIVGFDFDSHGSKHLIFGVVASPEYAEFLREQLAPLGRITMRRMFGKTGVFCDGVMLGMVTENTLFVRVDDDSRAIFKEAECFPPLNYEKKGSTIDLSFWRVPERLFDEPDELVIWAQAALAAARRVAATRERTGPSRKS